jgi:hypothetical protein
MTTPIKQGDQYIRSDEPADNSRGRNGDSSPSSVTKAPAPIARVSPPQVTVPEDNWQRREVDASPLQAAHGHGALIRQMNRKLK